MYLPLSIYKFIDDFRRRTKDDLVSIVVINSALILLQFLYIRLRYAYINSVIPIWYTRPWGDPQLGPKDHIYYIPLVALFLLIVGVVIFILLNRYFFRYLGQIINTSLVIANLMLFYSIYRIVTVASVPFTPLIDPNYLNLFLPFVLTYLTVYYALPFFIDFAHDKNIVTNPQIHDHPGMVLNKPSARGGGFFYAMIFLIMSLLFVGYQTKYSGLYLSVFMVAALGLLDDIQNTSIRSKFRKLENPFLRLILLFIAILPVILSGVIFGLVSNPLGGTIDLSMVTFEFGRNSIPLLSAFLTILWMLWIMNVLSWSNGIDGQYSGIVGIASAIIALLALRFTPLETSQMEAGILAAISSGAAFGFTKYTWNPSKIMWGFGAMSAGLVLAVLSILIQGKILTSFMIILIPFLDALVTVIRRLLQKKNPLVGDKGHLHHLLLERGWSPKRIALFYWFATLVFGLIGVITAERYVVQVTLILSGIVAFIIVLLNVISIKEKNHKQPPETMFPIKDLREIEGETVSLK
jgi:UDP-GlcNAc:undecaprenyl-phosphate GlcNAc-1-phosphate transferase